MFSKILQNYLRFWAKRYLRRVKPKIIAVTGSAGKTTTKEAIFEVLKAGFDRKVRKSEGNLNTIYGVELAILGFKKPPVPLDKPFSPWPWLPVIFIAPFRIFTNSMTKYLILEIAADKPGDIKYTTTYVKSDIVVVTNIGSAHLEIFGSMEKIIEEKTQLLQVLPQDGFAILNIDDEPTRKISYGGRYETKTFAIYEKADIMAKNIVTEIEKLPGGDPQTMTKFQITTARSKFLASSPTLGRETNIYPILAAAAVAEILNLSKEQIIAGAKNIKAEKHRMEVLRGKNDSIIIDDSYNANPLSMKAALSTLKILPNPPSGAKKIAVLGDMLELGKISDQAHKLIGEYAKEVADDVIAVGQQSKLYDPDKYFADKKEATDYLLSQIDKGDIILIKASRGIALEDMVTSLKK